MSITEIKSAILNRSEAAQYLHVTERWMMRARSHGIASIKMGRHRYFLITDLDAYIARCRVAGEMK